MNKLLLLMALLFAGAVCYAQPITATKGGYLINLGDDNNFDKAAVTNAKADVVLVDFTMVGKGKNFEDSLALIGKVYQNPANFSVVTGVLSYVSATTVKLTTNAKFKLDISNLKYNVVLVKNDGRDNSGATKPPLEAYKVSKGGHGCSSCACDCYRTANGNCTHCGFGVKVTAPHRS